MDFNNAKKQFEENLNLFSSPQSQPEKYNLYAGLMNIAKGLEKLEYEIESIKQKLQKIETEIRNNNRL